MDGVVIRLGVLLLLCGPVSGQWWGWVFGGTQETTPAPVVTTATVAVASTLAPMEPSTPPAGTPAPDPTTAPGPGGAGRGPKPKKRPLKFWKNGESGPWGSFSGSNARETKLCFFSPVMQSHASG